MGSEIGEVKAYVESRASTQLAVLAAAPVVAAEGLFLRIARALAGDAQAHAGHSLAPRFRNRRVAFLTMFQARPRTTFAARARHRISDGRVNLFLHGAFFCPTGCHVEPS